MKKILFILLVGILTPLFVTPVFADDEMVASSPAVITLTPTPTSVQYQMPYPGILPTNPLYKLKTLRDRLIGFLISDPIKKAQFDLLQSDKRMNAGWYVWKQNPGEGQVISDIISKGNNYFSEAIISSRLAKRQGDNTVDVNQQIYTSSLKHEEMLQDMIRATKGSLHTSLEDEYKRMVVFSKEVNTQGTRK